MNLNAAIFSSKDNKRKMKKYVCVFLLLFIVGCGAYYSGYSNYSSYTGFSSHLKQTTGTSNLTYGYKDPPVLDINDPFVKYEFEKSAKEYLDGVINDLKEVSDKADNATEKINALVDAFNFGFEHFSVRYIGRVLTFKSESNFGIFGYPEFPDFDYFLPPTKPYKPLFLDNEFMVDSYNFEVRHYNKEVADFTATIKDYIKDAEHYIENCKNDYREIRENGLSLLRYIDLVDIDADRIGISLVHKFGGPPKPEKAPVTQRLTPIPKPKPEVDTSSRIIKGYRVKRDASGEIAKDKDGKFIFIPVYEEDEQ